eukprot:Skav232750  [mRNA]  locus=scaffold757:27200:28129:+ [translate_table: standard]
MCLRTGECPKERQDAPHEMSLDSHEELKVDEDVQEAALASERYALLNAVKVAGATGATYRSILQVDLVDGYALRTASKRMQADRVLVFAPEELRKDREVRDNLHLAPGCTWHPLGGPGSCPPERKGIGLCPRPSEE